MARIQAGDRVAFEDLLERHLPAIHAYAWRLAHSRSDADDLAQETFIRVWQKAATFRAGTVRVSTWMHRITHNLFVDAWRRREPVDPLDDEILLTTQAPEDGIETDSATRLNAALSRLPLNQRTAVSLSLLRGFTTEETGHIMGLNGRAVESLIARARRTLREGFRIAETGKPS